MTFDEWFNEVEVYSLRSERFYDNLIDYYQGDNAEIIEKWLRAAYEAGREHESMKYMDDLK